MWIFDSYYKGCVELWGRERGLSKVSAAYPPSFYMHLKDPPAHKEMIEALESRFRAVECSFQPIFGPSKATGSMPQKTRLASTLRSEITSIYFALMCCEGG